MQPRVIVLNASRAKAELKGLFTVQIAATASNRERV